MSTIVDADLLQLSRFRPTGLPRVSSKLLDAIRAHGVVDPIVVRPIGEGKYEILSNEVSWLAAQQVSQMRVPVDIRNDVDDREAADIVQRSYAGYEEDPIEEALYFEAQLGELGGRKRRGNITKLAALSGRSRTYISHALRLLGLPEQVQQLIRCGALTPGHARTLVTLGEDELQVAAAQRIVHQHLSVRSAEQLTKDLRSRTSKQTKEVGTHSHADLTRLESQISDLLGCTVRIDPERGVMNIDYCRDSNVLQGVLERMGYRE